MTLFITPCYRCPLRHGCSERVALRKKLKPLGLKRVEFECAKFKKEFRIGRRITLRSRYAYRPEASGYITDISGFKFRATVDDHQDYDDGGEIMRFRRMRNYGNILRFENEPDSAICKYKRVRREDGSCDQPPGYTCLCVADVTFAITQRYPKIIYYKPDANAPSPGWRVRL